MPAYDTYTAVGAKEDVSKIISNISPTKMPFQTSIGAESVHQKIYDWQEDTLRAAQDNNQAEGFDASFVTIAPTTMRENVVQILAEAFQIAGSTEATAFYGRAKESAYQASKSAAQVKRDLENAFVGTAQNKVKPSNNSQNRKMAGFQLQLDSTTVVYSGASDGSKPLIEADVLTVLKNAYNNGAEPNVIMVTPDNAMKVADFAKASGRYRNIMSDSSRADQKVIVNAVDLYVSPYGEQRIVINRFLKPGNTLVYDNSMWAKVTFRPWTRETLAKTGDSIKMMLVGEFSLKHKNYLASGAIVEKAGPYSTTNF